MIQVRTLPMLVVVVDCCCAQPTEQSAKHDFIML
jgi:hypothetical protein